MEESVTDTPNHIPTWRDRLTIAAQIAGIIACCAAVTTASIIVINYLSH